MYLHRLIYYGTNKIRELGLPLAAELKAIIAAGHRHNPAAGITGALVFNERHFLGVLEGDRRMVSAALVRIAADRRCGEVTVMSAGPVDERRFDDWLSVYAGHSEAVDRLYLHFGLVQGLDPPRMGHESALRLAEALCRLDPKALAPVVAPPPAEPVEVIKVTPVLHGTHGKPASAPA